MSRWFVVVLSFCLWSADGKSWAAAPSSLEGISLSSGRYKVLVRKRVQKWEWFARKKTWCHEVWTFSSPSYVTPAYHITFRFYGDEVYSIQKTYVKPSQAKGFTVDTLKKVLLAAYKKYRVKFRGYRPSKKELSLLWTTAKVKTPSLMSYMFKGSNNNNFSLGFWVDKSITKTVPGSKKGGKPMAANFKFFGYSLYEPDVFQNYKNCVLKYQKIPVKLPN